MKQELKDFIKSHIDLIDKEQFEQLYLEHRREFWGRLGDGLSSPKLLTEFLLSCDIDPLRYVKVVPKHYLSFSDLSTVNLPEGIKIIDESAFYGMKKLSAVTIPASCELVEAGAFECCKELTTVRILNKNTKFAEEVFYLCFTLLDVFYPGTVHEYREHMATKTRQIYTVHCTDGDYIVDQHDGVYLA